MSPVTFWFEKGVGVEVHDCSRFNNAVNGVVHSMTIFSLRENTFVDLIFS